MMKINLSCNVPYEPPRAEFAIRVYVSDKDLGLLKDDIV